MKKIVFALLAFSSLMVLSCRQQEDLMDSEDLKSLTVLNEAKAKVNARTISPIKPKQDTAVSIKRLDSSIISFQELEYEKDKPPIGN
ncbi:hypothetical protein [Cloacibacterium rupense]|nr:hypothetical protein [Cloacibacterium rupense]